MRDNAKTPILLVDDDVVIRDVLHRVLTEAGYEVTTAGTLADALKLAETNPPQVALLDLRLPDGDAAELGEQLHRVRPDLPLLLMTGDALRLQERPELAKQFQRVMIKPINLDELRRAIGAALTAPRSGARVPEQSMTQKAPQAVVSPGGSHHAALGRAWMRSAAIVVLAVVVLFGFIVYALGVQIPGLSGSEGKQQTVAPPPPLDVKRVKGQEHTIVIPEDVLVSLGIRKGSTMMLQPAEAPTQMRPLTLSGSTALDPSALIRIRANFTPTKVLRMGQVEDEYASAKEGHTVLRDLRSDDRVKAGDVLAEFYSLDVANRKSDMVDALVQLQVDHEVLRKAELGQTYLPDLYIENARSKVKADESTIARAKRQLESMGISRDDIRDVYKDAEDLLRHGTGDRGPFKLTASELVILSTLGMGQTARDKLASLENVSVATRSEYTKRLAALLSKDELERWQNMILIHATERDPEIEKKWARVVVKAPIDGVIVERNANVGETIVDNTVNLFQIAKPDRLMVIGNADERDLPELLRLHGKERRWTVSTSGAPADGITAPIEDISLMIDPNQHSAVVKGFIDNPHGLMRGAQLATETVYLPPPPDVVKIPIEALVDEGQQTFVFVQVNAEKNYYALRRVQVTHRFEKSAFVKKSLNDMEKRMLAKEQGDSPYEIETLKEGDKVLTRGVLMLKKELTDQESGTGDDHS